MNHKYDPDCSCWKCDEHRAKKDNLSIERRMRNYR